MDALIGQTISHYRILAKISEAAGGILYQAVDTESNRPVALRILSKAITSDISRRQRAERDAKAASSLNHPNIGRVLEFSRAGDIEYAVLEAPEGESAYDFLERGRPHRRHLLRFAKEIASALEAAHGAGLVHGPLDPSAIFISPQKNVKLHDFGFSVLDAPPATEEELRALFGRSAYYVSPEQVEGASPDIRSDIFSFGALIYHMRTGQLAFRADTVSETWKAIVGEEVKPVAQLSKRALPGMDQLLERCLRKHPDRRFEKMDEIVPLLDKIAGDYVSNPEQQVTFIRKNSARLAKIGAGALAIGAALAAGLFWWQKAPTKQVVIGSGVSQITKTAGFDTDPAISKDGNQVAYASDRGGGDNLDIWVQPAGGGDARQLTNDPADDREPVFSPDGQTIAFRSDRNGGGVYLVSAKGGTARLIAADGRRPRYSPDGRWIAYWTGPPGLAARSGGAYRMFVVAPEGGAPREPRADFASATYPTWSSDSKSLLFIGRPDATRSDMNATDWWVTSVDGSGLRNTQACAGFRSQEIVRGAECGVPGDWTGNHVLFWVPSINGSNIWRATVASPGGAVSTSPVRVTDGKSMDMMPLTSGDGRVVFARETYNADIWAIPISANEGRATGAAQRRTKNPAAEVAPSLSDDGSKLVFQSNRGGQYNPWLLDVKTGKESPIGTGSKSGREQLWPSISPDGTKVAHSEMRIGKVEHFYTKIGSDSSELLCDECGPAISGWNRDGSSVLIDAFHDVRRFAVSLLKISTRDKTVLMADPNFDLGQARFSPDGRWIAFTGITDGGRSQLFLAPFREQAPVPSTQWIPITDGKAWERSPQWSPDGKLIYFASSRDGHRCVWAQRVEEAGKLTGEAFAAVHFHAVRRSPVLLPFDNMDLFVGRDQILVSLGELTGNVWSVKVKD